MYAIQQALQEKLCQLCSKLQGKVGERLPVVVATEPVLQLSWLDQPTALPPPLPPRPPLPLPSPGPSLEAAHPEVVPG